MPAPLESWRVVDLTDLDGALCGRILADLGADVLRIEQPDRTAETRDPVAAAYRNANKTLISLDLDDPASRSVLDELLAGADVLIDNLQPARRRELSLDVNTVAGAHPRLVRVVMADFGLSGPRAGWQLEPLTAQAAGGPLYASGFPDLPPCWFPGFLGPDCASIYGYVGAVAAMLDRTRHGMGQLIEVSVQEAVLAGTNPWGVAINDYLKVNPLLPAKGTRNADGFYWVLPAADGWVRTVIGNEKQWTGFVRLLRDPEVFEANEWHDPLFRRINGDVIRLVAGDLMRDRTRAELFEEARAVGATLGIIHLPDEYVDHEQTRVRRVFSRSNLPGLEGAPLVRPPLGFSVTPGRPVASPSVHLNDPKGRWPQRPVEGPSGSAGLLLDGIRVVEFGMAAVGPEVSLVLSELGADVIKVESSVHLDVLRLSGFDRINCGFAFNAECRGRRSVALNLDTERGRELAFALCAAADVVVENFRGGVLDRMGLDYEAIKGSNPGVVYASSQGYGRDGPLAEMPAYGPLNLAFVGLHHLWNHPEAPYPCGTSLNHPDHLAGKFLAGAVLCALDHRRRTGEGQRIDMAQTDLAAYLRGEVYVESWLNGTPVAAGNSSAFACPHGVFPSDGDDTWLAIAVACDDEWQALCEVAGWELDPQLATLDDRLSQTDKLEARLSAWTAGRPAEEAAAALQSRGVSAIPVMGPLDHLADEHLDARDFIVELEHPEVGLERHAGNPIRMSLTEQHVAASAPCLGADTAEVLADVLGMDEAEIDLLTANGVCV